MTTQHSELSTQNSALSAALLNWYARHGRDLPWRHTRDPYAIWLSEVILQQTRIAQGTDYWHKFMRQWPTVEQLAAATEDEVLLAWQGLGYYSRARNLHAAAQQIAQRGSFPDTYAELRKLKGVGPYTAAAIASLAFDEPQAVVDGNVYRVLSRYFGIDTPIDTTEGQKLFAALAQELLPPAQAALYNQAIMDFGALQCTPRSPRCADCPLVETCQAHREGTIDSLPAKHGKVKVRERHFVYIIIECAGRIAIHQRPAGDIWQGLWEPYMQEDTPELPAWASDAELLHKDMKHVLTHQVLYADCYRIKLIEQPPLPPDYRLVLPEELNDYALPRLVEKLITNN